MTPFHIYLHARPPGIWPLETQQFEGRSFNRVVIPNEELTTPLPVSFEEVASSLVALPRMFFEPDGSFVWVAGAHAEPGWQIDGVLWDRGGKLQTVELKGTATLRAFDQLISILTPDSQSLVIQLLRQALLIEAQEFRRFWIDI